MLETIKTFLLTTALWLVAAIVLLESDFITVAIPAFDMVLLDSCSHKNATRQLLFTVVEQCPTPNLHHR
jgi:hypothetical protein